MAEPPPTPRPPGVKTLRRYGMYESDWWLILHRQGGVCAVCKKVPRTGRFNVDHDHVKGWKKMAEDERRRHVRGLLCHFCNHYYVGRCITVEKAEACAAYLRAHRERLAADKLPEGLWG